MNADGTPADIISGGDAFWYCNVHSEETHYNKAEPEWSDINNSGLETFWTVAGDDRRDFSYNKLREIRSEKFHDYLMSATVFEKSGADRWDKGASFLVQDVASYKDDDGKTQGLKQIKVTYKTQGAINTDRKAGYVATYDKGDFESFDELYQLLWEDFGFAVNFNGVLPSSGFEIKYREEKIAKMYASIYTLVTPDNESTEEYDAVYKFSRAIELANEKHSAGFDLTNHHDDNLFKTDNHQTWGYSHILATLYSPGFYLGEYTNNLTVGLGYTFSTGPDTWRNGSYKVSDSYDNAAVDFLMVDANGNYTQDFLVFFQNQLDNNRISGFELLDLSKVGCTLGD